jgi:hypothetical protein
MYETSFHFFLFQFQAQNEFENMVEKIKNFRGVLVHYPIKKRKSPEPTIILFFILLWKGIPEPDKLVTELSQVFLHGKAAFFKNAITLFDYFID